MRLSRRRRSGTGEDETERGLRGFLLTATVLVFSFAVSCFVQFGGGPVFDGMRARFGAYQVVWPQEWVFFTGNLDKDTVVVYRAGPDGRLGRRFEREVWDDQRGGLDRARTGDSSAAVDIARRIPDRYWQSCGKTVEARCEQLPDPVLVFRMNALSRQPRLCGALVLALEHVTPSGSGRLPDGPWVPYRVAAVDVRCGDR
ncbi:hypothetical protein AB0L41_24160 [Amycolatopsis mediterranei]|uniref:hypothetical protein n=1 Tax=Amycolatopsis mediterranei TaxID=33910 RepID=UPI00343502CA